MSTGEAIVWAVGLAWCAFAAWLIQRTERGLRQ